VSYTTLVSSAVLADHLEDPGWRVFDCRHQLSDPAAGRVGPTRMLICRAPSSCISIRICRDR
jgi:hypothetical protein